MISGFFKNNVYYLISFLLLLVLGFLWSYTYPKGYELVYFSAHRNAFLNNFFIVVNYLGEIYTFLLIIFSFILLKKYRQSITIGLAGLSTLALMPYLKNYFGHPRPLKYFNEILHQPGFLELVPDVEVTSSWTSSFPSGHTAIAFTLFSLVCFYSDISPRWRWLIIIAPSLAGMARIYLCQHFIEDVLGGMIFGILMSIIFFLIEMRIRPTIKNKP